MNKKSLIRITTISASFAILLTAFTGVSALAGELGNPKQFAVEMIMASDVDESAGQSMVAKFYVGKDHLRVETNIGGMGGGGGTITIFEDDQVITYMIIPQMKQYMKQVGTFDDYMDEGPALIFGSPDDANHPCQADPDTTCEKIGPDTVLGRSVDKYRVTDIEDGVPTERIIWFDRELLFPIKMQGDGGTMEATSIEVGSQPDEHFEIPAGYTEIQY